MDSFMGNVPPLRELMIDIEFGELKKVYEFSEKGLKEELEKLEQWYDKESKKIDPEQEDYFDDYYNSLIEEIESMLSVVRTSLFSVCFGLLEKKLNDFCDECKDKKTLLLKVTDVSGKGIERAKLYLEKAVGITLENELWGKLLVYNKIRNYILHNGSIVKLDGIKSLKPHEKKYHFEIIDMFDKKSGRIILTKEFVLGAIQTSKTFLLKLPNITEAIIKT